MEDRVKELVFQLLDPNTIVKVIYEEYNQTISIDWIEELYKQMYGGN